ncbi:serine/threonine protein kinase [Planomonospora sp. ID91781]|uniref:serine/threonine-protein kinase n=1 Tax=Planomonospora sp. ID91781 TaxID=2738135 RepID=UPI0018C39956|nr:serine/threonine-protein kinase [Planomonospora sp. ID91781]MBG0821067.1 serine/threonine protein kinase [Planomonospora sp. ID91781]
MPSAARSRSEDPGLPAGYRVLGRLGAGGQGVVYLAESAGGERVAVKMLHRSPAGDLGPFLAEAELIRRVRAFCTAQVVDSGVADGRPYLVTEYVDGPSLARVIEERGALRGPELVRLVFGTLTALAAVHQAGVVHRDFKPANVLLGRDGPRVIDFGIARVTESTAGTDELVGTPPYMAPEQFDGSGAGPPADMFAWASTVVCAATGSPPFGTGPTPTVINRILNEPPDLGGAAELDGELRELVSACLDKDPARRPTAAGALMRLLGERVPAREILPEGSRRAVPGPPPGEGPTAPGPASGKGPAAPGPASGKGPGSLGIPADGGPAAPPDVPGRTRWRGRTAAPAALAAAGLLAGSLLTARLLAAGDVSTSPLPFSSPLPSSSAPAAPPTMAAASTTDTPLPGTGITLHENPADGLWVSSYQDWRDNPDRSTKGLPGFLRDPRTGAFRPAGALRLTVAAPGGRLAASLSNSRLIASDYDRITVTDRASGASYDIRTVDRPLITFHPAWNDDGTRILLTVYEGVGGDAPSVGFAVVDPVARTARITRMPAAGPHPYVWGVEPGTVMHRGSGGAVRVHGLDGRELRVLPGVGDLHPGGAVTTAEGGLFLTSCPDAPEDTCVWTYPAGARKARVRAGGRTAVHGWLDAGHLLAVRRGEKTSEIVMLDLTGKAVRVLADGPAGEIDEVVLWYTPR